MLRTILISATSGMIVCENWLLRGLTESSSNGRLRAKNTLEPAVAESRQFLPRSPPSLVWGPSHRLQVGRWPG